MVKNTFLVLRFSAMGDVAISASVMREVAAQNPDCRFVFATRAFFAPLFDDIPNFELFPSYFKEKYKGLKGIFKLYKDLKNNYKITAVADLHDVLRTKLLKFCFRLSFKNIKIATINKGRKEKRALCNESTLHKTPLKPAWQRYVDVFRQLNINTEIKPPHISFLPEKVKKVGISPFAQHKGKIYPQKKKKKVLETLSAHYEIYLFGGGNQERELCETWQEKYQNVHSLVGKYSLKEELNFISTLDVMLSMDSSGMHLASLCNVPCISVWGATHPYSGFVGFGQEHNPQIQLDLPCRPCSVYGNKPCKFEDYRCLYGITPEKIIQRFKD
jgi:ADP-heptose:LPS heptosyltransferase